MKNNILLGVFLGYAIAHFSLGATVSLILFRIFSEKARDYLRYDIIVATLGGLWAMIPDLPYLFGVMEPLVSGRLSDIFFLHGSLDKFDPHDSVIISALLFGFFLLILNLVTLESLNRMKK